MAGFLFVIGLIMVSGLVAYVGDNLGRKIGKAKLMIFGLRPKHTSIVIAIATGMVITAITIVALAVFSKDVRDMLLRFEDIKDNLIQAESDYRKKTQELTRTQEELDATESDLRMLKDLLASRDRDAILLQQEINDRKAELETLTSERDLLKADVTNLKRDLGSSKAELSMLQVSYDEMAADLDEKERLINVRTIEIVDIEADKQKVLAEVVLYKSQIAGLKSEILQLVTERDGYIAKIVAIREGGIKVEEGRILAEAKISTGLSDADLISAIGIARYEKWENDPIANVYGNPMVAFTLEQITEAIEDIRR